MHLLVGNNLLYSTFIHAVAACTQTLWTETLSRCLPIIWSRNSLPFAESEDSLSCSKKPPQIVTLTQLNPVLAHTSCSTQMSMLSYHLRLHFLGTLFSWGINVEKYAVFIIDPMHAMCPAHITLIIGCWRVRVNKFFFTNFSPAFYFPLSVYVKVMTLLTEHILPFIHRMSTAMFITKLPSSEEVAIRNSLA